MMTIKEMIDLGFTDDQIKALLGVGEAKKDEVQEVQEEVKEDEVSKDGEVNVADDRLDTFSNMFDEIYKRLDSMTKAIQSNNVLNASVDSVDNRKTTDDIISSIILPKHEREE